MSEAALDAEKITDSEKQEKHEKIRCALCSCTLNSETQAQAHFTGVRHLKLLERHGLPLPDGVSRDKLFVHQRKTHQSGQQRRQVTSPTVEYPVSLSNAQLSAYECTAGEKRALMCQLCGVGFNSAKQAESHYTGQKHKARETELKVGSMSVPIRMCPLDYDAARPYYSDHLHYSLFQSFDQNCSSSQQGQFIIDSRVATATTHVAACTAAAARKATRRPVNRENPRCEVCNREFNSNVQALSHFQGASHNDEVIRRAHCGWTLQNMHHAHVERRANRERPQCSICNIHLNSASQMADHLQGRSHKRKEQEKSNISDDGTVAGQTESDGK